MIVFLVLYSSITTSIIIIHWNKMDSIVTMNGKLKPPDYNTTFFIVDSYGVPVPNAVLCTDTYSGASYSTTNESGYCYLEISDYGILSITVNGKIIYEESLFYSLNKGPSVFVIKYDP